MSNNHNNVLEGFCTFYAETGTEGGEWAFQDKNFIFPRDEPENIPYYDYNGLHILKDGDHLTIFSPDNPEEIVWSGVISLKNYPIFTESAFGWWIHADQNGIERETWAKYFFDDFPGKLIPSCK